MKILGLSVKNVKRIRAVELRPDGNVVVVGGRNGQGKSSLLDSIAYALGGKDGICREPVRRGEEKAEVVCDLGDLVVKRTFTPDGGGTLTVTAKDGAKYEKPQTKLDDLIGQLSFDPLAFSRMAAKDQAETLRELVGLDFSHLDAQRTRAFQARTDVNRDGKALAARYEAMPPLHEDVPVTEISSGEVVGRLDAANRSQVAAMNMRRAADEAGREVERSAEAVAALEARLTQAKSRHVEATANKARLEQEAIEATKAAIDPEPISAELVAAELVNRKVRENAARTQLAAELDAKRAGSKELSGKLDDLAVQRGSLIASAKFPVEGLGFDLDGFVTMNALPFDQASQAEQLRVSVAIGLALNPELRVLLIRDASLLDSEALALMGEMAVANDAQLWLERVEEGGATVVIEDGSVVEQTPAEAEHQTRMAVQA